MKVLKPDNLSLLYRVLRFAKRDSLSIGMLAGFRLERTAGDTLLDDNDMWPLVTQALGEDGLLDEGYPKPAGEYKVYGAAHAPAGRQIEQQRVSIRLGPLSKSLVVTGERQFNALGLISAPKPFACMPLTPETAFGGEGFKDNPRGKGGAQTQGTDGAAIWPLPNVEYENCRITNRGDHGMSAGFWGFDLGAPLRQQHIGTCDERWLRHEWPHLPSDTRPELFMSAAEDQRLPSGYFAGDERFVIENMHPSKRIQQGALPGLRARCFVNRKTATGDVLSEVPAHAETVWLFPELECGVVLYRALASCADDEASDVKHIKAAWELSSDAPLLFEHYRDEFLREIAPAVEAEPAPAVYAFMEEPAEAPAIAMPAETPAAGQAVADAAAEATAAAQLEAQSAEVHALVDQLNADTRALMRKHNLTEADLAKFMPKPDLVEPAPTLAEVEKLVQELNAHTRAIMEKHNLTEADLAKFIPRPDPAMDAPTSFAEVGKLVENLNAQTRAVMEKHNLTEADLCRMLPPDVAEDLGNASLFDTQDISFAVIDALMQPPPLPAPDLPPIKTPSVQALPEEIVAAPLTREDVIARHAARTSLAGYDLTGLDLSGLDLTGADFSGATLDKVSFAKSRLGEAVFEHALLREADFSEANLQRARFSSASAEGSVFAKADLLAAKLIQADFTGGDFSAANLAGAELMQAVFDKAKLPGVNAAACRAEQTSFTGCDLSGADFGGAMLSGAQFNESLLAKSRFSGALCQHAEFYGAVAPQSDFTRADLRHSRADDKSCFEETNFTQTELGRACWDGAQLHKASFEGAQLAHADFSNVKANAARFGLVSAKGARFDRADLSGAEMSAINLFGGSLRKANLSGTRMVGANLYGVDFIDTQPTLASVEGANIDHTILQFRPPVL